MKDASNNYSVYGCGVNIYYTLGNGTNSNSSTLTPMTNTTGLTPVSVSCGRRHTMVLMKDTSNNYSVYGCGNNLYGQLGNTTNMDSTTLTQMSIPVGVTPVSVTCGDLHTMVLMNDNSVYSCGYNYHGQLGDGSTSSRNTLTQMLGVDGVGYISDIVSIRDDEIIIYPVICFKEGTLIQTINGYVPIQLLRKGDLIKTLKHDFVPIDMIGKTDMYHSASHERIKDQLYKCTQREYPEVFEDLVITGHHSILVDNFKEDEREKTLEELGDIYVTDGKYRLPACVDSRTTVYENPGNYNIYHIALENDNYYMNYGIYANGLLVETCSKRFLKELSDMTLIE